MTSIPPTAGSGSDAIHPVFYGDAATASRRAALFLLVLGPIPTVMLFGQKAVWVFGFGCIPAGLFLVGYYFLMRRIDRLELDDSTGMIVPYMGRPISYDAVRSLRFETGGAVTRVSCRAGAFRRRPLLHASGADQTEGLRQALIERCPEAGVLDKARSAVKAALLVVVLLSSLHAGFLYYCREKWPVVKVTCEKFEWPSAAPTEPGQEYELDGMRYSIPARFERAAENEGAETHRFRDHSAGDEIRVHSARLTDWLGASSESAGGGSGQPAASGALYLGLLGISSTYDLMRWPYCDGIGAVPVILKAALIAPGAEPWDLKLYEAKGIGRSALIQVESFPGDYSAQILAASDAGDYEIMFTVTGMDAIDSGLITTLLRGLGVPSQ